MKICTKCKEEKLLSAFHIKSASKDGYSSTCKQCKATIDKTFREKNKDILKDKSKVYRETNKELISNKRKEKYSKLSSEDKKLLADKKALYNKNASQEVKQRKKNYDKSYFASVAGKMTTLKSVHKRRAQKLSSSDSSITTKSLEELKIKQDFKCVYCKSLLDFSINRSTHLDHVIPLSKGGTHSITNVVWSCASCNLKKSNKITHI